MTNKENKLKLMENEAVRCETFALAAQVLELADKLGASWSLGESYLDYSRWSHCRTKMCYLFHKGVWQALEDRGASDKTISATEWLNRHDIFVYGQEVLVWEYSNLDDVGVRIYIAPKVCVTYESEGEFHKKNDFTTYVWKYMKSPYPTWEEVVERNKLLEVVITLNGKPVSPDIISEETWNNLRKGK